MKNYSEAVSYTHLDVYKRQEFNYYKPESDSDEARNASVDQAVADGANVIVLPGLSLIHI